MTDFATKEDLNGLGIRLNNLEVAHMQTKTIMERNSEDIDILFDKFERTADKFGAKADEIGKKADGLGTKIVIGSCVLVLGLIIKELVFK